MVPHTTRAGAHPRGKTVLNSYLFSGRAGYYTDGRPGYPVGVIEVLRREARFKPRGVVADIGSGTGKLSRLFLANGNEVFGVEPNADMRREAERIFARVRTFHSVVGSAETTHLPDSSTDLVAAGQSFHWFNPRKAKAEFARILRAPGWVLLVWNTREGKPGTFGSDFENLIDEHRTEGPPCHGSSAPKDRIRAFFGGEPQKEILANGQWMDYPHLLDRIRSTSCMPRSGARFEEVKRAARAIFERHAVRGRVHMDYATEVYLGKVTPLKE